MAEAKTEDEGELDAYALLSKPTLDISDPEALRIIEDLRRRREAYVKTGKVDKPKKEKIERKKLDADEKKRNTEILLAGLKI